jgi:hypothetical protein
MVSALAGPVRGALGHNGTRTTVRLPWILNRSRAASDTGVDVHSARAGAGFPTRAAATAAD